MKNLIKFIIGGYWRERSYQYVVFSNLNQEQIKESYKIGVEKIGFNLIESIAVDYENNHIKKSDLDKLISLGFDICYNQSLEEISIDPEFYFDIYLFFVKIGNSDFEYEIDQSRPIDIGGYGLFCS